MTLSTLKIKSFDSISENLSLISALLAPLVFLAVFAICALRIDSYQKLSYYLETKSQIEAKKEVMLGGL